MFDDFRVTFVDVAPPAVTIKIPTPSLTATNTVYTISGTATDNVAVATVYCNFNGAGWQPALSNNGWTNWNLPGQMPIPGTNAIQAYAVDTSGNISLTNTARFLYAVPTALTVTTNQPGWGAISPNLNNSALDLNVNYALKATPAAGFQFVNWTNNFGGGTNSPFLTFTMQSNLVLTAIFKDVQKPVLHILSPTPNQIVNSSYYYLHFTASDNAGVAAIRFQLNNYIWMMAFATNDFTEEPPLIPGTNTLQAYAVDTSGNVSATNSLKFVYALGGALGMDYSGRGSISPNYAGLSLNVGENYTVTATPAAGFAFRNWSSLQFVYNSPFQPADGRFNAVASGASTPASPGPIPAIEVQTNETVLTNRPTLTFTMSPGLYLLANFVDIAPPTVSITAPTQNQRVSNTVFTVTGTARDNVGVAGVYYQINGTGWFSASTGNAWTNWFTPSLDLLSSATNTIQVYAVDAVGNLSATNTVRLVNRYVDPAPDSLAGTVALNSSYGSPTFGFGTNTFSQIPAGQNVNPSVGEYEYDKFSPSQARLIFTNTAPLAALGVPVVLDLTFTNTAGCIYSNENTGATGTLNLLKFPYYFPPGVLTGQTVLLIDHTGSETKVTLGNGTLTLTNAAGQLETDAYAFQRFSPLVGLLTVVDASQDTNFVILDYENTNSGLYFASADDAGGNALTNDNGEFILPAAGPVVPASPAGLNGRINFSGNQFGEIAFDARTYSLQSLAGMTVGTYTYARQNATNFLLTLNPVAPAGPSESWQLDFVASGVCLIAGSDAVSNALDVVSFYPLANEIPASLGGATLYATNNYYGGYPGFTMDDITCHGSTFTQFETSGPNNGLSGGTFTYTPYSQTVALLTLKYTHPASLVGATNYLEATFSYSAETSGFIDGFYYDNTGDSPAASYGQFELH